MEKHSVSDFSDFIQVAKSSVPQFLGEASKTDSTELFPEQSLQFLTSSNFLTACISSEFGGRNLGIEAGSNKALLTVLKWIGAGNLVLGRILEGHFNAQILIHQFGTRDQKRKFAEDAFEGKLFGVWNTQGSDGTFLKAENGHFYLKGSKIFATGIGYVSRPVVTAALPDGSLQMCIVPLDEIAAKADESWWNPLGMRATRSFKITFENAVIPAGNLLGKPGNYYEEPSFRGGSVRFSAVQLGAAEILLKETIHFLQTLKRTEDPFQKMRIGEMSILMESGNHWLRSAAESSDLYRNESSPENAEVYLNKAHMFRTATDEICTKMMNLCQQCIGARGLNTPYHFERIIRDLSTYLRQPAPDHTLAEVGRFALKRK